MFARTHRPSPSESPDIDAPVDQSLDNNDYDASALPGMGRRRDGTERQLDEGEASRSEDRTNQDFGR